MLISYWSDDQDKMVVEDVKSLAEDHPNYEGDGSYETCDILVHFPGVGKEELLALASWASQTLEEDLVAFTDLEGVSEHAQILVLSGADEVTKAARGEI